jgi:hypothetical protein
MHGCARTYVHVNDVADDQMKELAKQETGLEREGPIMSPSKVRSPFDAVFQSKEVAKDSKTTT